MPIVSDEITKKDSKVFDQRAQNHFGFDGTVLMEIAGYHVFEIINKYTSKDQNIVIICGRGNNAGDAFVIARTLIINAYKQVNIVLCQDPEKFTKDTLKNYSILKKMKTFFQTKKDLKSLLKTADVVVDGLFGSGLKSPIKGDLCDVVDMVNNAKKTNPLTIFSIDIPSGFCVDGKKIQGKCIKADHTITFLAPKKHMTNPLFTEYIGKIFVKDIGINREFLEIKNSSYF